MSSSATYVWAIPALPLIAAAVVGLLRPQRKKLASAIAILAMAVAAVLSIVVLAQTVHQGGRAPVVSNFRWFQLGTEWVSLGWLVDPMSALMLVMVTVVGLLIFVYSTGYMAHDPRFTRFFCFLCLFAAAMLGLVISNSLLLLFICWEIVGLTSYLLIGFWYEKPAAGAAAMKAFITTRIGDLLFLLGIFWLYSETNTLLFYDDCRGCLEASALSNLAARTTILGMAVSTLISLLIFGGAVGKSGQLPLHVWLPDAMEGPTPVSALIHAATMVAAGVFLVARVYPLMAAADLPTGVAREEVVAVQQGVALPALAQGAEHGGRGLEAERETETDKQPVTTALKVVTWLGALTAIFAASIAVAQTDIKRILAYSTVSQLGFMMLGLGVGGVGVGMFHLITHAVFKALLFLGAGSVIHGCHEEQDIRRLGGLRRWMPITFATYAIGMMALAGFPLVFSGFWSKDAILHAARGWMGSSIPFYLGLIAAFLTAFYMTRQVGYVFFGASRQTVPTAHSGKAPAHESPMIMTVPLMALAGFTLLLGLLGTPAWPWFQTFLTGSTLHLDLAEITNLHFWALVVVSGGVVLGGMLAGWMLYVRRPVQSGELDPLEKLRPDLFALLKNKYFIDEVYAFSAVNWTRRFAGFCAWIDDFIWSGVVQLVSFGFLGLAWVNRALDEFGINYSFDTVCRQLRSGGAKLFKIQNGRIQFYLAFSAGGLLLLVAFVIWRLRP